MVKSESNREEEKEESFKYDPVWNSITHIPISLGAKRWSLMSVALAVIGVTVFVCLTLRKRGLRQAGCRESGGAEGRGDRERECLRPSQLGYGTAARTNPWASETSVLNSRYLVSACPERGSLHQYVPLPLSAPDIFILSGPLLYVPPQWLPSALDLPPGADGPLLVSPLWALQAGWGERRGAVRCSGAELKAVLCQPVFCRGLITQTPMEKLLAAN